MIFYSFLFFITIVVTALALRWLSRKPAVAFKGQSPALSWQADMQIYRHQMAEIETEKSQGLLDDASANEARLEIARRMFAAEKKMQGGIVNKRRAPAFRIFLMLAVLFIPLFSWCVYFYNGSPQRSSHPFSMILVRDPATLDDAEKLVRAEVLAMRNPRNGTIVDELAGHYLAAGRFQDAVNTYNRAIAMNGESAERLLRYAMALTGFAGGVVNQQAEAAFREAARLDPLNPDARVFLARGMIQNGRQAEAIVKLEDFLKTVPVHTPWRKDLAAVVADLKAQAFGHQQSPAVTPEQRRLIVANVDKLSARLAAKPDDLQGWIMLIKARLALEEFDAAKAALQKGLDALTPGEAGKLAAFAREKGLFDNQGLPDAGANGEGR